jgi:hypothetical protein
MSKYTKIIPLGQGCNMSFLLQNANLKKETSLFEWFVTSTLNIITDIIDKLYYNKNINIYDNNKNICINDDRMFSAHYSLENCKLIFNRRAERFLNTIKNNNKILFIRFEYDNKINYTVEDINKFVESIKNINPNIDEMKLLLIINYKLPFTHPFIIEKYFSSDDNSDWLCKGENINTFFQSLLTEVGYDISDKSTINFNDISEV